MMERKKQRISDLFYDNRFLMAFSVLFALVAWLIVATEFSETQNTIYNVPVQINYSNINNGELQPFLEKEYTVDVTISGKRYIVESDDIKEDIIVVADTSFINKPGKFPLNLNVTAKSVRPEYEFVSVYPQVTEEIKFDYFFVSEKKIVPEITFSDKDNIVREGYYVGEISVSDFDKVSVSGPKSDVERVSTVVARAEIEGDLHQSAVVEATLVPLDENKAVVSGVTFNIASSKVNVKIPVYYEKELDITCSFSNIPTEYIGNIPFEYSVSPSSARFAIYDEDTERNSIEIGKIDFSELDVVEMPIKIDASEVSLNGAELLDENIKEFVVTVNVSGLSKKSIVVSPDNVKLKNVPNGVDVEFSEFKFNEISVVGPADKLSLLNNENIVIEADFGGIDELDTKGSVLVPVAVSDGYCWSYGEYIAEFIIL